MMTPSQPKRIYRPPDAGARRARANSDSRITPAIASPRRHQRLRAPGDGAAVRVPEAARLPRHRGAGGPPGAGRSGGGQEGAGARHDAGQRHADPIAIDRAARRRRRGSDGDRRCRCRHGGRRGRARGCGRRGVALLLLAALDLKARRAGRGRVGRAQILLVVTDRLIAAAELALRLAERVQDLRQRLERVAEAELANRRVVLPVAIEPEPVLQVAPGGRPRRRLRGGRSSHRHRRQTERHHAQPLQPARLRASSDSTQEATHPRGSNCLAGRAAAPARRRSSSRPAA